MQKKGLEYAIIKIESSEAGRGQWHTNVEKAGAANAAAMCLDDYIEPDSICRVIEAYVKSLDMAALG